MVASTNLILGYGIVTIASFITMVAGFSLQRAWRNYSRTDDVTITFVCWLSSGMALTVTGLGLSLVALSRPYFSGWFGAVDMVMLWCAEGFVLGWLAQKLDHVRISGKLLAYAVYVVIYVALFVTLPSKAVHPAFFHPICAALSVGALWALWYAIKQDPEERTQTQ